MGIFVALVANVISNQLGDEQGISAMWSIREDFVAVFVGQAPMVYPIIKKSFWRKAYGTTGDKSGSDETHEMNSGMMHSSGKAKDPYSLTQIGVTRIDPTESTENIIKEDETSGDETRSQGKQGTGKADLEANARHSQRVKSLPARAPGQTRQSDTVRVDQTFQLETSSNRFDQATGQPVVTPWHDSRIPEGRENGRAF